MTYVTCPTSATTRRSWRRRRRRCRSSPAGGSGSASARARTSTSTSSASAGPRSACATRCSAEAVDDHRARCSTAATVNYRGDHFDVESARLWDLPGRSGCRSASRSRARGPAVWPVRTADLMIATEPKAELGEMFDAAGGAGKPRVGQVAVSLRPGPRHGRRARARAVPLVRPRLEGQRRPARPGRPSTRRRSRDARRRSAEQCRAGRTSRSTSRRSGRSSTPASPRSRSSRSAATTRRSSSAWAERELLPALRSL